MTSRLLLLLLLGITQAGLAQTGLDLPPNDPSSPPAAPQNARELRVLSPTLAAEQIDRAVLNRLMQEILDIPDETAHRLGVNAAQLQDILTLLSNAHGFINDNDLANVRAMCDAWESSTLQGEARINAALAAYDTRAQFTRDFISKYYSIVLLNIEAGLQVDSQQKLAAYMQDRRRRMATAGAISGNAISSNARSGEESIRFHCRAD